MSEENKREESKYFESKLAFATQRRCNTICQSTSDSFGSKHTLL